jgi:hypothetical protein
MWKPLSRRAYRHEDTDDASDCTRLETHLELIRSDFLTRIIDDEPPSTPVWVTSAFDPELLFTFERPTASRE